MLMSLHDEEFNHNKCCSDFLDRNSWLVHESIHLSSSHETNYDLCSWENNLFLLLLIRFGSLNRKHVPTDGALNESFAFVPRLELMSWWHLLLVLLFFFPCNTATTVAVSTCTAFIVAATGVYDAFSIAVATVYAADRAADATLAAVDAVAVAAAHTHSFASPACVQRGFP